MSSRAWLTILEGTGAGLVVPVYQRAVIGRTLTNEICVKEQSVARRHGRVERITGTWMLTDGGSTNGTFLNGKRIAKAAALAEGDTFSMGWLRVRFSLVDPGLPYEVRRIGDWLVVDPTDPVAVAVSATTGERVTGILALDTSLHADDVSSYLPRKLGHAEGWCFVEDIAGVRLVEVLAASTRGGVLPPEIEGPRRWVEDRCWALGYVVDAWVLTFDGRITALTHRRRPIDDALEREPGPAPIALPPPPDLVRGLLNGLVPDRVTAHERLVEDIGVLGVEGLRARVVPSS